MTSRRKAARAGYTLVEVMMAVAVMTVGAVGIIALQVAATHGNIEAREMTTASTSARTWIERLKRDGLNWTQGGAGVAAADLARTNYLLAVPAAGTEGAWFRPNIDADFPNDSYAFDHFGRDTTVAGDIRFCTHVRLSWLYPGQAIRADVRVWWHRRGSASNDDITDFNLYPDCGAGSEAAITTDTRLRFVNASTVIRWIPPR